MTRAIAGAGTLAAAVWCAAGRVTVASVESSTPRIGAPAPWWWLLVGAAIALALPRLRKQPAFALPAALATVPWWPVPLPAVALLWTGPLAWLPIGLTVVAALGPVERIAAGREPSSPFRSACLAGGLTGLVALGVAWAIAAHVPAGDEPHYLAISQSLIRDGDLRIENNHHDPDFVAAFGDLKPDYIARGRNGEIYSIHAPGLAAVVAPGYAAAGYPGAQASVALLAAVAAAFVWLTAWRATQDSGAAWFAFAAIAGSAAFLLQSVMVFPDAPGACAVALAAWVIIRLTDRNDRVTPAALVLASAALAALPWLHTRFAVLAAGLGAVIVWQVLTDPARSSSERARRLAVFAAVPAVTAIAWFAYFAVIYGTPNPAAPYGNTSGPDGTHLAYAPGGLLGLLLDGQFGLLAYTPILAAAAAGLVRSHDRVARVALALVGVALAYLIVAATYWMWWAGVPATPARLVTAVLPLLAVPLARAWQRATASTRASFVVVLALSLAISAIVIGVGRGDLAWNLRDAEATWLRWLGPVVNLARGWPSFFWSLDPGHALSEVPFGIHAVVWAAVMSAGWCGAAVLAGRRRWSAATARLAAVSAVMLSLSVAVPIGWSLTGTRALNPARSQFALLRDASHGRPLVRVAARSVRRLGTPAGSMLIAPDETGPEGQRGWGAWSHVPGGTYQLQVSLERPRAGRLLVSIDRAGPGPQTFDLQPMSVQMLTIDVPEGSTVTVAPDGGWAGPAGVVALRPLVVAR